MIRTSTLMALLALLPMLMVTPASAQDRYKMQETENGIIRLDTQTGAVSHCTFEDKTLTCSTATDDKASYEEEIERLSSENKTLRKRAGVKSDDELDLPSEAEIEQTVDVIENFTSAIIRAMKRLQETIEDLDVEGPA
jgi:hypothetical protein